MILPQPATEPAASRLDSIAADHGLEKVRQRLDPGDAAMQRELAAVEQSLAALVTGEHLADQSVRWLLLAGGKRVRPLMTFLAARAVGAEAPDPRTRTLATVAEAIHAATLLHDDVIDLGETRRGTPASRTIYGNAASVLGGDLLLVRSLRLAEQVGLSDLVGSVLDVLERMITAEALQLQNRGALNTSMEDYMTVVEGKTASLFEWAAASGARASCPRDDPRVQALAGYGHDVGVAFQIMDDLLDLLGDPDTVGKDVFADLREGKLTFPLIHALQANPHLTEPLAATIRDGRPLDPDLARRLCQTAHESGGIDAARREVSRLTARAIDALAILDPSPARHGLEAVSRALEARVL